MILLVKMVLATVLIAAMIMLCVIAGRKAMRQRLTGGQEGRECADTECFGGCGRQATTEDKEPRSERNDSKRSAYHAP